MPPPDEPQFRAHVASTGRLSPSLRRIRFAGAGLSDFSSSGDPDERVLIEFDGHRRSYTVRHWDPAAGTVDVDFAIHAGGAAAAWARAATVGSPVLLSRAKGWYHPPADANWQLLLADLSALPAAARIVENLAPATAVHVIAEVPDAGDEQHWVTTADLTVTWLHGTGNGHGPSALPDHLASLPLPPGPGYVWSAGESGASRTIRAHLRRRLGWGADRFDVMGYWQADKERWLARYREVESRIEELTARELSSGKSFDEVRDAVDAALDEAGL
ncbi:siderophore-interacting protein [Rhodococcus sp. NPDC059234]|uniref:siderophore-interacting protein n=1 Tax=Rhodococcus sp. NPDC059234 TaxID=3346781 RepID=UPI0036703384